MIKNELLGTTFESSLRILILLDEIGEYMLDEYQISCIDFIAIYGADFGLLDNNLHGNGLFRYSEFSAKSKLVSLALKQLVLNKAVKFTPQNSGYIYSISSLGEKIVHNINDNYSKQYRISVKEVLNKFSSLNVSEMQSKIYNITLTSLEV